MSHQVTIQPSGHRFTVEDDETILEAALREGFSLPYGCRNGACGSCKGTVLQGELDYGVYQPNALKDEEKARGRALFCRAKPLSDMAIEVREIGASKDIIVKTMPCRVEKLEKLADDVMRVRIKLPANERLQFLAGQYIDFQLKDGRTRSYSLANAPHDDALLELHIRHVPGGLFTDQVFTTLKERDILRLKGPLGSFFIREDSDKPMIFVAGGTGFAPIKSMLEHAFATHTDRELVLYWGARARKDLYLAELPQQWLAERPNFSFIPVLSQAEPDDAWQGRTGFVHEAVLADFADLSGYEVYTSGAPAMVDSARESFVNTRGLPEDAFFADAFVYAADTLAATSA
ncbi:NAD(P)H-flavin reductase [Thiobacillus denitrificans ATCC 25259]|uniref:NAD(P)H-flavin reductase n=1 Tax=Thiobacillus denitrificans (strain ATCC 25259 / T1) TaxID=292415 RepID=Q3SFU0_THIDA|nr:CDP-6-deoxy-delta-3,4-glucoseen reductase [Thiobacillus denitrificans]AAZ98516.1 NAD(P)H-flavin reductase [Thiobacillus denitrificans ATCC 25259]